jgi:hypothetical protein
MASTHFSVVSVQFCPGDASIGLQLFFGLLQALINEQTSTDCFLHTMMSSPQGLRA